MRILRYLQLAVLVAGLGAAHGRSVAVEIVVPTPAEMVLESEIIIEGEFLVRENGLYITVDSVLKGNAVETAQLRVLSDSPGFGTDLSQLVATFDSRRVVVGGLLVDGGTALSLPWWSNSIWPYGGGQQLASIGRIDECRSFVESLLRWDSLCRSDSNLLLADLMQQARTRNNSSAVLGYVAARGADCLASSTDLNDAITMIACEVIDAGIVTDQIVANMALVAPSLPPSISLKYFLGVSDVLSGKSAQAAILSGRAVLVGRSLISATQTTDADQIRSKANEVLPELELEDARFTMKMFESADRTTRTSANSVLDKILNGFDPMVGSSPTMRTERDSDASRRYWAREIEARER